MKILPLLLGGYLLLYPAFLPAQTIRLPVNAAYTGLGAYSLRHTDVFSFTSNPASLAQLKNTAAGVYGERRFLLDELSNYTAVAGIKTGSVNIGVQAGYYGSANYNETNIGLACGRKLGSKLDIGAQFNYHGIRIAAGYGNASAITVEIGTVMHLTERLHAGLHINNPVGGKFGNSKEEKLSSVYTMGLGFDASEKLLVSAEIEKEEGQPVNVKAGLQYKFIPQLLIRAGMSSATSAAWLGVGLTIKTFRVDIITSYHPQLGITPGLLLLFNSKR